VVDVARALGVSHGSVYRHFATKAKLREAVTARWLEESHAELKEIAHQDAPAPERLRTWLTALFTAKRRKAGKDPELFATYLALAAEHADVVQRHVITMTAQLAGIITDGMQSRAFSVDNPLKAAKAVWDATIRFHNPAFAADWSSPDADKAFTAVCDLILRGLY
jgi:AcrR family transcriptional regulator